MAIRSYIDLTLFIRVLYVASGTNADDIQARSRELSKDDLVGSTVRAFYDRRRATVFHERYHYWQGLSLSYLVRYAALTRRAAFRAFTTLARARPDFHMWSATPPDIAELNRRNLVWENSQHLLFLGNIDSRGVLADALHSTSLSIVDLLEGAASIAEWQVAAAPANTQPDATDFQRWLVHSSAYTRAYEFASRVLRDDTIALRSLIPLICASFRTTKPLLAFLTLLQALALSLHSKGIFKEFVAQHEPCKWHLLVNEFFQALPFDSPPDSAIAFADDNYCELTLERWMNNGPPCPPLDSQRKSWLEALKNSDDLRYVINMPGWASKDAFQSCIEEYTEPLSVISFEEDGWSGPPIVLQGKRGVYEYLLHEMLLLSLVRRAWDLKLADSSRICYHSDCPEYAGNFCNFFPLVPKAHHKCVFPMEAAKLVAQVRGSPVV